MDYWCCDRLGVVGNGEVCVSAADGDGAQVGQLTPKTSRIQQRLEACRVGLQQLDALRGKHQRLMQVPYSYSTFYYSYS